jgi:hypothetical protein
VGRVTGPRGSATASAAALTLPTDLTKLSAANKGNSRAAVADCCSSGGRASYGSTDMPTWGSMFRAMGDETAVRERVTALTRYLASIQTSESAIRRATRRNQIEQATAPRPLTQTNPAPCSKVASPVAVRFGSSLDDRQQIGQAGKVVRVSARRAAVCLDAAPAPPISGGVRACRELRQRDCRNRDLGRQFVYRDFGTTEVSMSPRDARLSHGGGI